MPDVKDIALYIIDEKYINLDEVKKLINIREKQHFIIIYTVNDENRNYNIIKEIIDKLNNVDNILSICIIGNIDEVPSFMREKTINDKTHTYPSDITYGIIDNAISIPVGRISSGNIINIEIQKSNIKNTLQKIIYNEEYCLNIPFPNDPIHKWLSYIMGIASNDKNGSISDDLFIKNELEKFVNQKYENYFNNINYIELFDGSLFYSPQPVDEKGNILDQLGDPTKDELVNNINNLGCGLIEYLGHGLTNELETTNFTTDNVNELTNANKYFILIAVACSIGDFSSIEQLCLADKLQMSEYGSYCIFASVIPQTFEPPKSILTSINDLIRNTRKTLTAGDIFLKGINSLNFLWSELQGNGLNTTDECLFYTLFGDPLSAYTPSYLRINKSSNPSIMYRNPIKKAKKAAEAAAQKAREAAAQKAREVAEATARRAAEAAAAAAVAAAEAKAAAEASAKATAEAAKKVAAAAVTIPTPQQLLGWTTKVTDITQKFNHLIDKVKTIPEFGVDFGKISLTVVDFEINIYFNTNVPYKEIKTLLVEFYDLNINIYQNIKDFSIDDIQQQNPLQYFITFFKGLYKMSISETLSLLASIAFFLASKSIKFNLGINELICNLEMEIKNLNVIIADTTYFLINSETPFNTEELLHFNNIFDNDTYIEITVESTISIPFNMYASFWTTPEKFIETSQMREQIIQKLVSYFEKNTNIKQMETITQINKILFSVTGFPGKQALSFLEYLDIDLTPTVRICFLDPISVFQWGTKISVGIDPIKFMTGFFLFLISLFDTIDMIDLDGLLKILRNFEVSLTPFKDVYKDILDNIISLVKQLSLVITKLTDFSSIARNFLEGDAIKNQIEKSLPYYEFISKFRLVGEFYSPLSK